LNRSHYRGCYRQSAFSAVLAIRSAKRDVSVDWFDRSADKGAAILCSLVVGIEERMQFAKVLDFGAPCMDS